MNIIDKLCRLLNEDETSRMIRWVKTFSKNHDIDPDKSGFFDTCVLHMKDEMGEDGAKGYCARALDTYKGSTHWRGQGKTEKEASKDVESNQNYPTSKRKRAKREKALQET
jgi:hypothetical protein